MWVSDLISGQGDRAIVSFLGSVEDRSQSFGLFHMVLKWLDGWVHHTRRSLFPRTVVTSHQVTTENVGGTGDLPKVTAVTPERSAGLEWDRAGIWPQPYFFLEVWPAAAGPDLCVMERESRRGGLSVPLRQPCPHLTAGLRQGGDGSEGWHLPVCSSPGGPPLGRCPLEAPTEAARKPTCQCAWQPPGAAVWRRRRTPYPGMTTGTTLEHRSALMSKSLAWLVSSAGNRARMDVSTWEASCS
ncbi:PREDICTED: uncharacterized protein LOC102007080 [Chinchilla lanigera]|uniref:uncharacterized protein LOC102007080 n=1 Tax=Chinchilla lanigera TaxID=34839 RepID=UPI00038F0CB4|nr:PREDICTED: uncharacterized protein LOC102007080 [Chinchilla lanigera]XP_005394794.1 PREDICTED: uncharacterized protein LOC102007080 [Chinchilla lanigera]